MSKQAEEYANKQFPYKIKKVGWLQQNEDVNATFRLIAQEAYEQAEKDIAERACNVLNSMLPIKVLYNCASFCGGIYSDDFIKAFRKKLEEE